MTWAARIGPSDTSSSSMLTIPLKRDVLPRSTPMDQRELRTNANDTALNGNKSVATLVFDEVPLRVGYGTHYAELFLGVPPQRASVIVDTGSHLTALPCSSCEGCGEHTDPLYDLSKSTTAQYLTCNTSSYKMCNPCENERCYMSQSYTEGSMWKAIMVDDLAWVGNFVGKDMEPIMKRYGVHFPIGCQVKETGLFITQKANGIMGMGRHEATLMPHLLKEKRLERNIFSLCFGFDGGHMVLGGADVRFHNAPIQYTPLLEDSSGMYRVEMKDLLVGNVSVGVKPSVYNSGRGIIVDSGTTDTFFGASAFNGFDDAFKKVTGIKYSDSSMTLTDADLAKMPTLTIVLNGTNGTDVQLEISPQNYLSKNSDGSVYGNFHFREQSGGVLGASVMVGMDVVFDQENDRVGFAYADCDGGDLDSSADKDTAKSTITAESALNQIQLELQKVPGGAIALVAMGVCLITILVGTFLWRKMTRPSVNWEQLDVAQNDTISPNDNGDEEEEEEKEEIVIQPPAARFTIDSESEDEEHVRGSILQGINEKA